eukprot:scaffold60052_cov59-Phaeocystis_antarctica.AAC.9
MANESLVRPALLYSPTPEPRHQPHSRATNPTATPHHTTPHHTTPHHTTPLRHGTSSTLRPHSRATEAHLVMLVRGLLGPQRVPRHWRLLQALGRRR